MMVAKETEEIGRSVLSELQSQREKLENATSHLSEIDEDLELRELEKSMSFTEVPGIRKFYNFSLYFHRTKTIKWLFC